MRFAGHNLLLAVALMVADTSRFIGRKEMHVVYRDAGAWLRSTGAGEHVVLAGCKPEPAFYGEVEFQRVRDTDPVRLTEWMRRKQVTHFFLLAPGADARLAAWLDAEQEPDWLTERIEFTGSGDRLVLWRVRWG